MEVEEVSTSQLLRTRHRLSADDAHGVRPCQLLLRRVGEERVHIASDPSVPHEVSHPRLEGAARHVEVAHDVEGEAVVCADEAEEDEVDHHVEEVREELQVEEIRTLVRPLATEPHIVRMERILGGGRGGESEA